MIIHYDYVQRGPCSLKGTQRGPYRIIAVGFFVYVPYDMGDPTRGPHVGPCKRGSQVYAVYTPYAG